MRRGGPAPRPPPTPRPTRPEACTRPRIPRPGGGQGGEAGRQRRGPGGGHPAHVVGQPAGQHGHGHHDGRAGQAREHHRRGVRVAEHTAADAEQPRHQRREVQLGMAASGEAAGVRERRPRRDVGDLVGGRRIVGEPDRGAEREPTSMAPPPTSHSSAAGGAAGRGAPRSAARRGRGRASLRRRRRADAHHRGTGHAGRTLRMPRETTATAGCPPGSGSMTADRTLAVARSPRQPPVRGSSHPGLAQLALGSLTSSRRRAAYSKRRSAAARASPPRGSG